MEKTELIVVTKIEKLYLIDSLKFCEGGTEEERKNQYHSTLKSLSTCLTFIGHFSK